MASNRDNITFEKNPKNKDQNVHELLKALDLDQFLNSSTSNEIGSLIVELGEYIKGGVDSEHKQLREAYHHIPKPQARKIRDYLACILEDALRYSDDRKRGRKRKHSK